MLAPDVDEPEQRGDDVFGFPAHREDPPIASQRDGTGGLVLAVIAVVMLTLVTIAFAALLLSSR